MRNWKQTSLFLFGKKVFIIFSKAIIPVFFDKSYLAGRWFNTCTIGWKWAWKGILWQKILKFNKNIPWPVSPFIVVSNSKRIFFHPDDLNNFQTFGNYFQNSFGDIYIGRGTWIAPNVGIITANHDPQDLSKHLKGENVIIGDECWIGMNTVLLPGVVLGNRTTVGAGSVVTKSFPEGHCVIAGNPARFIRKRNTDE